MIEDYEAWDKYPQHHNWFNKLYVAEQMKYICGPSGVAPTVTDYYIVRPTYNLSGMSLFTKMTKIEAGDFTKVPPGYFWCEFIPGFQYSATYEFVNDTAPHWKPVSCWVGTQAHNNFSKFIGWTRSDYTPEVPAIFNVLSDVQRINIEFKGNRPIEVHLRDSPDPDYDELIPVWKDSTLIMSAYTDRGYQYIESYDDANGFLDNPRLGFLVR